MSRGRGLQIRHAAVDKTHGSAWDMRLTISANGISRCPCYTESMSVLLISIRLLWEMEGAAQSASNQASATGGQSQIIAGFHSGEHAEYKNRRWMEQERPLPTPCRSARVHRSHAPGLPCGQCFCTHSIIERCCGTLGPLFRALEGTIGPVTLEL